MHFDTLHDLYFRKLNNRIKHSPYLPRHLTHLDILATEIFFQITKLGKKFKIALEIVQNQ